MDKPCKLCKGKKTISVVVHIKSTDGTTKEVKQDKTCPQCSGSGIKGLVTK